MKVYVHHYPSKNVLLTGHWVANLRRHNGVFLFFIDSIFHAELREEEPLIKRESGFNGWKRQVEEDEELDPIIHHSETENGEEEEQFN